MTTSKRTRRAMSPARALVGHPVTQAVMESQLKRVLAELQTDAGLQAYIGGNAKTVIKRVGMLCFVADNCVRARGLPPDNGDVRVLGGLASTLMDLTRPGEDVERHRGALRSGVAACQRILQDTDTWTAGQAFVIAADYVHRPAAMAQVVQQAQQTQPV